ncbi:unnamed protein product [Rotaria sordida]|uniref:Uncharacterized protein n=1 Tax=Rotaria sordida TaxID=392033 RepID=A0A819P621_9BILA|nr:unnamed protein product [Rotaria sordida]CAF4009584.1 unnamed protein product [Rotaria sordida]
MNHLLKEIKKHEQLLLQHLQNEYTRISQDYSSCFEKFQECLQKLFDNYIQLKETIKQRRKHIELLKNIDNVCLQHANKIIDLLIVNGHANSAHIAKLKDILNEYYLYLLETIETRLQSLITSWNIKIFILNEIGHDQQSIQKLLCKHQQFETELVLLVRDIQRIQQDVKRLNGHYAGAEETEIKQKEI